MSQRILSIDLGSFSIKVLRVVRRVQEIEILDYIEEPLTQHSRLSHDELVGVALEKILQNHALEYDVLSVSFPGHYLSSRVIELPFSGSKRIAQVIDGELESFIPFPLEEVFVDYHVLDTTDDGSKVLAVYVQEERFQKYLDGLLALGLDPKYFCPDFSDLVGLSQVSMVSQDAAYAFCDIGHNKTNFVVLQDGELKYVRTIGLGGHHFTRAIQRAFNLNFEKAESLKLARGKVYVREQDADQISRILNKVATELVMSMKQALLGARQAGLDIDLQAIYVSGGGSLLSGLTDFVSFHLKMNLFTLNPLLYVQHDFNEPEEQAPGIAQVLATALRPIYSNRFTKMNFRKGPFAFKQDIQLITRELKTSIVMFVIMILMAGGYYFYSNHFYDNKVLKINKSIVAYLEKNVPDIKPKSQKNMRYSKAKKDLKGYVRSLKKTLEGYSAFSELTNGESAVLTAMYEISRLLPPKNELNFEVNDFIFSKDFIRLESSTNDTLNVEKIIAALNKSSVFKSIEKIDEKKRAGGRIDFKLKIEMAN